MKYRLPNPKAESMGSKTFCSRCRSGLKSSKSGPYSSSFRIIALYSGVNTTITQSRVYVPNIGQNNAALGDQHSVIYVILHQPMRRSERRSGTPAKDFLTNCLDIWQMMSVSKIWKPMRSNHSVQFFMSLLLYSRANHHGEDEVLNG